eukprot:IDg16839t1
MNAMNTFDPLCTDPLIHEVSLDLNNEQIRGAARLSLFNENEQVISAFLLDQRVIYNEANPSKPLQPALQTIAHAQTNVHSPLQQCIVSNFIQSCPIGCPLPVDVKSANSHAIRVAKIILREKIHLGNNEYTEAWRKACEAAKQKAYTVTTNIHSLIATARPHLVPFLPPMWRKDNT